MPKLKWSENFSVGVAELDEEHKRIIEMINAMHVNSDAAAMFDVVMQMFNYFPTHFQTEEKLMRRHGYSGLDRQILEHKEFMAKTTELARLDFGKPAARAHVASYLREWFVHHILEEDMKYKDCLSQKDGRRLNGEAK